MRSYANVASQRNRKSTVVASGYSFSADENGSFQAQSLFINHPQGIFMFTINFRDYEIFNLVDLRYFYIHNVARDWKNILSLSLSLSVIFLRHVLKEFTGYFAIHAISLSEIPRSVISAIIVAVIRISMTKTVSGCIFAPRMVIARRSRNVRELFSPMMHR